MRALPRVGQHVGSQSSLLCKLLVTHVTYVRPLSGVDAVVFQQIVLLTKSFATTLAIKQFPAMPLPVDVELLGGHEAFAALLAVVRLLSRMGPFVDVQVDHPCKITITNITDKQTVPRVFSDVDLQLLQRLKLLVAPLTVVWPFSRVETLVLCQLMIPLEPLHTHLTHELFHGGMSDLVCLQP